MSTRLQCDGCGQTLDLSADAHGGSIRCDRCGTVIPIPTQSDLPPHPDLAAPPADTDSMPNTSSPLAVTCSQCHVNFHVSAKFSGQRIKCRQCGAPIAVPDSESQATPSAIAPLPQTPPLNESAAESQPSADPPPLPDLPTPGAFPASEPPPADVDVAAAPSSPDGPPPVPLPGGPPDLARVRTPRLPFGSALGGLAIVLAACGLLILLVPGLRERLLRTCWRGTDKGVAATRSASGTWDRPCSTIVVRFTDVPSAEASDWLCERLRDIAEADGRVDSTSSRFADGVRTTTASMRWPGTPRELAEQIDFGTFTSLVGNELRMRAAVPSTLPPPTLQQTLRDLKSPQKETRKAALDRLARRTPGERRKEVVAALIEQLRRERDRQALLAIVESLGVWGSQEVVPVLGDLLNHGSLEIRAAVIKAIARFRGPVGAECLALHLLKDRRLASDALASMGPVAERAVIPYLQHIDHAVRLEACKVLKAIGTKESVAALQVASQDSSKWVADAANEALARLGAEPLPRPTARDGRLADRLRAHKVAKALPKESAKTKRPAAEHRPSDEPARPEVAETLVRALSPPEVLPPARRSVGRVSIPFPADGDVIYSTPPADFVALGIGGFRSSTCELWSLETGRKVAAIPKKIGLRSPYALSPDGAYLAGSSNSGKGTAIWSFKLRTEVRHLSERAGPEFCAFISPTELLTMNDRESLFKIWDVTTGKLERWIDFASQPNPSAIAVSPQGRYLAFNLLGERAFRVYDLSNGELVRTLDPPWNDVRLPVAWGLAFSADLSEIAAICSGAGVTHIVSWSLEDSKVTSHHEYPVEYNGMATIGNHYRGPVIQWLPDESGWLVWGYAIYDRGSGERLWEDTADPADIRGHARAFLDADRLLVVKGPPEARVLTTLALPEKQLATARQLIRDGGKVMDLHLPPLIRADWSEAKTRSFAPVVPNWSVKVGPHVEIPDVKDERPLSLKSLAGNIQQVIFSRDRKSLVVVDKQTIGKRQLGKQLQLRIDRYDLDSGSLQCRLGAPRGFDVIALAPNASSVLLVDTKDHERLDLWSIADKRQLVGWRPYEHESREARRVIWAGMVTEEHLLTLSSAGKLVTWLLPACKALHVVEGLVDPAPQLSPQGKLLAVWTDADLRLLDPLAGTTLGVLSLPEGSFDFDPGRRAVAFNPAASQLAALVRGRHDTWLHCWDLATGKSKAQAPGLSMLTRSPYSLQWAGEKQLLVNSEQLVDLDLRCDVWRFLGLPRGFPITTTADSLLWHADTKHRTECPVLQGLPLPPEPLAHALELYHDPKITGTFGPRAKIDVHLRLAGPPNDRKMFRRRVSDVLQKMVRDRHVTISSFRYGDTPLLPYPPPQNVLPSTGTAFVVSADGHLVTCAHVVEHRSDVRIVQHNTEYPATILAFDRANDLALLKIDVAGLQPLPLADSTKVAVGEEVSALGFPLAHKLGESIKVSRGIIAGIITTTAATRFQIDASLNPGNSGGPLTNRSGQVVAVNSAMLVGAGISDVGFAAPVNYVRKMLGRNKVPFEKDAPQDPLDGPQLVAKVAPSVLLVRATVGGPDTGKVADNTIRGPVLVFQVVPCESKETWSVEVPDPKSSRRRQRVRIPRLDFSCKLAIVDDQGHIIWESVQNVPGHLGPFVNRKAADVLNNVRTSEWETIVRALSQFQLPLLVESQDGKVVQLPGFTRLNVKE